MLGFFNQLNYQLTSSVNYSNFINYELIKLIIIFTGKYANPDALCSDLRKNFLHLFQIIYFLSEKTGFRCSIAIFIVTSGWLLIIIWNRSFWKVIINVNKLGFHSRLQSKHASWASSTKYQKCAKLSVIFAQINFDDCIILFNESLSLLECTQLFLFSKT